MRLPGNRGERTWRDSEQDVNEASWAAGRRSAVWLWSIHKPILMREWFYQAMVRRTAAGKPTDVGQ